jgi:uncharacterized protein YkwD
VRGRAADDGGVSASPRQLLTGAAVVAILLFGGRVLTGAETLTQRVTAPAASSACPHATELPDAGNLVALRAATLCLVNRERAQRGLGALVAAPELERAAQRQSVDMGERKFFAHVNPDGASPDERIRAAGYPADHSTGENLYAGYEADATPAAAVDGWMHSPGHRANILRPQWTQAGIGIACEAIRRGDHGRAGVYTNTFGGPPSVVTAP